MNPDPLAFGLEISLVGMSIVFLVLALVVGAITLMRRLDERWLAAEEQAESAAFERTPTVDQTTVVLIAAAVATLIAGRHRIRQIRRLPPGEQPSSAWSVTGRAALQGSHVIRTHPAGR